MQWNHKLDAQAVHVLMARVQICEFDLQCVLAEQAQANMHLCLQTLHRKHGGFIWQDWSAPYRSSKSHASLPIIACKFANWQTVRRSAAIGSTGYVAHGQGRTRRPSSTASLILAVRPSVACSALDVVSVALDSFSWAFCFAVAAARFASSDSSSAPCMCVPRGQVDRWPEHDVIALLRSPCTEMAMAQCKGGGCC